ncbi:CDK2-associated and cullin domain-containing protein 1-like [Anneissia japonica]|uniref:CDK2-associated and cullin domain-containing protein 1-like n=1 Tax=Anneissia japonica TaxID=1529436 RepID=UPI00142573C3|nr:CDK2-associated and cullin domain-containing protein 1-like [Anneissia japonica]
MEGTDEVSTTSGSIYIKSPAQTTSPLLRPAALGAITQEDYQQQYWPILDNAVRQLLANSGSYVPISYEQMYSCVYKCVCQQHSEKMYEDLFQLIKEHLSSIHCELQDLHQSNPDYFLERFHQAMQKYNYSLKGIVPIFNYMNRFYVTHKLNTDLHLELTNLFTVYIVQSQARQVIRLLEEAQSRPFAVKPATAAGIIKGLYSLNPEFATLNPKLFAKYIPNVLPPTRIEDLPMYAEEAQLLQQDLQEEQGFSRIPQDRKRSSEQALLSSLPIMQENT